MLVWSLSLNSTQIRLMRRIADAEIDGDDDGEGFEGYSKYASEFRVLVRRGLAVGKDRRRARRGRKNLGNDEVVTGKTIYTLSELGVAILAAVDIEVSDLGEGLKD